MCFSIRNSTQKINQRLIQRSFCFIKKDLIF
nr:MAG TPA: hypothetical protein [Caudoviricetes sp.]